MRTTVDLPEDLLAEIQEATQAPTRRKTLIIALEDFVRRQRIQRVIEAAETLEFDLDASDLRKLSLPRSQP